MKKVVIILGMLISLSLIGIGILGFSIEYLEKDNQDESKVPAIEVIKENLKQGIQNLKQAKSITWEMDITREIETENVSSLIKMNLETNESEVAMNMAGEEFVHSYTILEDGVLVSYTYTALLGNSWIRTMDNESSMSYDTSYFDIILQHLDTLVVLSDMIYQITIPKEQAQQLLSLEEENIEETTEEVIANIPVSFLISDKKIETIQMDFSNAVQTTNGILTKYIMTNTYKEVGSTVIIVPNEVKESAVSSEELFS